MQLTSIKAAKSIVGIILLGVGIFVLREHLSQAAIQARHLSGNVPLIFMLDGTGGGLQKDTADVSHILRHGIQQLVMLGWPLLLVSIGVSLSKECGSGR
ncbi:MAG TPA: hypothetical protein VFU86_05320 [Terriglobales bacterium]|nr:hypothetical protein [Terriglobales bacterium]